LTSGVTPDQIERIRPRLVEFTARMLDVLARSDQRAKGELYVRGLLTDGQRKSMQPMAQRLGVDHQKLQQFVTSSTWDYSLVRRNVARWAADTISPQAYVVDDTGFAKDGGPLAVGESAVLRDAGQDRQLPGRGERATGHRPGLAGGELAPVLPGRLGRHPHQGPR
jgi:DDE superfamily endonuclease